MQQRYPKKSIARYGSIAVFCAIGLNGLIFAGCGGGSGNGSGTAVPQGNAGVRAIAIAADQSIASGIAFPLAAVLDAAPTPPVGLTSVRKHVKTLPTRAGGGTLVFDPSDSLYKTYTIAGNTQSVAYYTDAAGTKSAGTASMTIVGATSFDTAYTAYPVTVNFTANVTAGTLPFKGSGTVVFTDASGANSLTGKFTLPLNNVVVSGKMSLDSSSNVSGSVDIVESGATLHVTNLSGNLASDLTGAISSDPYGWKGTGMFNLQTGKFSITLNTGSGTATAASDASGNLTLHFADGTSQTITNPLTSTLAGADTGSGSSNGGGTTTGVSYTVADLGLGAVPLALNNNGEILTKDSTQSFGGINTLYRSSANASPQALMGLNGRTVLATSINDSGEIVGGDIQFNVSDGIAGEVGNGSYDYANAGATPTAFKTDIMTVYWLANRINNKREVVGKGQSTAGKYEVLYWKDPSMTAVALPGQTTELSSGDAYALPAISQDGRIVGISNGKPLYWQNTTTQPIPLAYSGTGTIVTLGVNSKGNIFARVDSGSVSHVLFWPNPQAQAQTLPGLSGSKSERANFIDENGDIAGFSLTDAAQSAVIWKNGLPQDLNSAIPPPASNLKDHWYLTDATIINDKGEILGIGVHVVNGGSSSQYVSAYALIPK